MNDADAGETRGSRRRRVLKRATILGSGTASEIGCVVRNVSDGGAEIVVSPDVPVPERFLLYVPTDGIAYRAELRWRRGDRAGLSFSGTEPKPSWHYG
jgi:hypothetical protein